MKPSTSHPTDQYIVENYLKLPLKRIAKELGRSGCYVRNRMLVLGLEVPQSIKETFIKNSQIKPGTAPYNKGKKQIDYLSPESLERARTTCWKKGNIPANAYNEIGKISIRKDSRGLQYQWICLELGVWEMLHKIIWEKEHGKIPRGFCVWFIDGDSLNCDLVNLELITKAENLRRNNLTDSAIAAKLARQGYQTNHELKQEFLKIPELLQAKRLVLESKKNLKSIKNGTKQNNRL